MAELLQMWVVMEVLGLLSLPLTMSLFRNVPDRGWAFSKALGLVVFAFAVWLPLMCFPFLPYSRLFIVAIFLLFALCCGYGWARKRQQIIEQARRHLTYTVVTELIFLLMLILMGLLRSFKPNIQSFEMFMDEGFIAAIMRSPHFPPNDMWLAGYSINYYYYAHYVVATLAKLLGQSPSIAFNTGISMFFGLTALNLFGVTCNIVSWGKYVRAMGRPGPRQQEDVQQTALLPTLRPAIPYGFVGVAMGLILGNLAATQQWWQNHGEDVAFNWFTPSRVIENTINEFPAFSFILSCFHAHVLTLAFTILCIGIGLNLFLQPDAQGLAVFGAGWKRYVHLAVIAVTVGGLFVMNGWDFPTYLALVALCIVLQQCLVHRVQWRIQSMVQLLWHILLPVGSLAALSYLFFLPFYLHFNSPSQGIGLVPISSRSTLSDELLIYGLFAFVSLSLIVSSAFQRPVRVRLQAVQMGWVVPMAHANSVHDSVLFRSSQGEDATFTDMHDTSEYSYDIEPEMPHAQDGEAATLTQTRVERPETEMHGPRRNGARVLRLLLLVLLVGLAAGLIYMVSIPSDRTLVICCCMVVLCSILLLYHLKERAHAFTLLLCAIAFTLVAGCEVLYLKDVFDGTASMRMNTVFKFYFQAWALLSVSSAAGLFFVFDTFWRGKALTMTKRWIKGSVGAVWGVGFVLLLVACTVYPIMAPFSRYAQTTISHPQPFLSTSFNLDGLTYLADCKPPTCSMTLSGDYFDPSGDYEAIRWINANITGDPVIVEAVGSDYQYGGRISTFTGLPTIIGWSGHEVQWRVNWLRVANNANDFYRRSADVDTIYTNPSPAVVLQTMAQYHAQYLYVGPAEYQKYGGVDLKRFGTFMQVVYDEDNVTIYKVK
jgi:uncharacterized membrane protein